VKSGIISYAQHLILDGVMSTNNYGPGANGIDLYGGTAVLSGFWASGNAGYGLNTSQDDLFASGGDLTGNAQGALNATVALTSSKICAVKGVSGYCR
jgi:hypothetical protein